MSHKKSRLANYTPVYRPDNLHRLRYAGSFLVQKTPDTSQQNTAPQTYCFHCFPRSFVLLSSTVLHQLCLLHQVRAVTREYIAEPQACTTERCYESLVCEKVQSEKGKIGKPNESTKRKYREGKRAVQSESLVPTRSSSPDRSQLRSPGSLQAVIACSAGVFRVLVSHRYQPAIEQVGLAKVGGEEVGTEGGGKRRIFPSPPPRYSSLSLTPTPQDAFSSLLKFESKMALA